EGDGETAEFDVRFGGQGERGRGLIDVSYVDQKEVNTADRDGSKFPIAGFPHGISSGTPPGRYIFCDPSIGCGDDDFFSVTPNAGVQFPVFNSADPDNDDFHSFGLDDRFNYQPFNHLVTPNER